MTWPSFMAAPFIVPRAATICSAVSSWRRASAACASSLVAREVGRARAHLTRRLLGREPPELRRAPHAGGRDGILAAAGHRRTDAIDPSPRGLVAVLGSIELRVARSTGNRAAANGNPAQCLGVACQ